MRFNLEVVVIRRLTLGNPRTLRHTSQGASLFLMKREPIEDVHLVEFMYTDLHIYVGSCYLPCIYSYPGVRHRRRSGLCCCVRGPRS